MAQKQTVKKLPRQPGPAGWNEILGTAPAYPEATGDLTADWLIIGGGFAGLSAAKRLCELRGGDSIMVLEAGRIAQGPAGRNSGFMIDLPHELGADGYGATEQVDKKQIFLNRHAQDFAKANAEAYEISISVQDEDGNWSDPVVVTGRVGSDAEG